MKKILVVTPRFPFDMRGACEQDRAHGIRILKDLGYAVEVITPCFIRHLGLAEAAEKEFGISIHAILYSKERMTLLEKSLRMVRRLSFPEFWDGAAFEYADPLLRETLERRIQEFKPDLVWFDYTYLWPLYDIVRAHQLPIITRSVNYEPEHFLNKTKGTFIDRLKWKAKVRGETRSILASDHVFAITPNETAVYKALTPSQSISTLPLRRLGALIGKNKTVRNTDRISLCFMGSNYGVHHMRQALTFVLSEINPLLQERYPDTFEIHVIGGRVPEHIAKTQYLNVTFHGYITDIDAFLNDIDVSLSPSTSGEGMQQKIFEPIVRGIPTVTSKRALAGYPLEHGRHVLIAENIAGSFVEALGSLISKDLRERISKEAILLAQDIFSEERIRETIDAQIKRLTD